jgi:ribose 5-phosphate isomerase B
MKIALGSDHRGVHVRRRLIDFLRQRDIETVDVGTEDEQNADYPDFARQVGELVAHGDVDRGILICGTGLGMAIAANKIPGVRATPVHDDFTAELSRRHNDSNVLCLSADLLGQRLIDHIVDVWLSTEFEGGRHARRLEKVREIERSNGNGQAPSPPTAPR